MSHNSSVSGKLIRFFIMAFVLAITGIIFAITGAFIGGRILGNDAAGFGALAPGYRRHLGGVSYGDNCGYFTD